MLGDAGSTHRLREGGAHGLDTGVTVAWAGLVGRAEVSRGQSGSAGCPGSGRRPEGTAGAFVCGEVGDCPHTCGEGVASWGFSLPCAMRPTPTPRCGGPRLLLGVAACLSLFGLCEQGQGPVCLGDRRASLRLGGPEARDPGAGSFSVS